MSILLRVSLHYSQVPRNHGSVLHVQGVTSLVQIVLLGPSALHSCLWEQTFTSVFCIVQRNTIYIHSLFRSLAHSSRQGWRFCLSLVPLVILTNNIQGLDLLNVVDVPTRVSVVRILFFGCISYAYITQQGTFSERWVAAD